MFNKKLIPTLLCWFGIGIVTCILMGVLLSWGYIGPEDTFLSFYVGVVKVILVATVVLGMTVELFVRIMKKIGGKSWKP